MSFEPEFLEEGQEPFKKSDVKNRGSVVINKFLPGPENAELRKHIRNLLNGAWDYSNIITHSSSRTIHEASVCLTMTTAVVSAFENLLKSIMILSWNEMQRMWKQTTYY